MLKHFEDGFAGTADPAPPPIIEPWRVALLFVSVAAIVWWAHCLVQP